MRKLVNLLLCLIILISMTGCSKKTYEVSFGTNLPTYVSDVKYREMAETDFKHKDNLTKYYLYSDGTKLLMYRWANDGKSLLEVTENDIKENYPNENYDFAEIKGWEDYDDGYRFGYYMSYEPQGYDQIYYLQHYFFLDGDFVVEAEFWLPATRMKLPVDGWTIDLPTGYRDGTLIKTEISDDAVAKYIPSLDEEYPNINIYQWEDVYDSLEEYAEDELAELYDLDTYEIFDFEDINGNKHTFLKSIYDEDDDGTMETNYDYTIDIGDDYIEFDFFVLLEDEYIRYSIPTIASSIAYNK